MCCKIETWTSDSHQLDETQSVFTSSKLTIEILDQDMKLCSKLKIKTPDRPQPGVWRRSGFFIVNFEHILHLVLGFL